MNRKITRRRMLRNTAATGVGLFAAGSGFRVLGQDNQNLDLPAVTSLVTPVTVQLRRAGGGCWGASFSTPSVSGPTLFKAKSD